jgi:uncharacterized membrane protein YcaP (DUF421 family)
MFLASAASLAATAGIAVAAYAALVVALRIGGKRTLSKWNAFDLVVTVALGSSLATVVLSRQTPLLQGLLAFAMLVLLQFAVSWLALRVPRIERAIKSEPALLVWRGRADAAALRRERVTLAEVRAAVRSSGAARVEDVDAVVLETDGSISVIARVGEPPHSALADVIGPRVPAPPDAGRP